jgi:hypothetical protein
MEGGDRDAEARTDAKARNPYAPPTAVAEVPQGGARLDAALYTYRHVALATFLGTTLGGAVVMALNEHRLGRTIAALNTLLAGVVGTGLLLTIGYVAPDDIPTYPISIAALVVMAALARWRQGAVVTRHYAAGGKHGSGWAAAGLGVVSLVVVLVPLAGFFLLEQLAAGR